MPWGLKRAAARTRHTPAPNYTATVAPFRAWRGLQLVVAGGPMRTTIDRTTDGKQNALASQQNALASQLYSTGFR